MKKSITEEIIRASHDISGIKIVDKSISDRGTAIHSPTIPKFIEAVCVAVQLSNDPDEIAYAMGRISVTEHEGGYLFQ